MKTLAENLYAGDKIKIEDHYYLVTGIHTTAKICGVFHLGGFPSTGYIPFNETVDLISRCIPVEDCPSDSLPE